METLEEVSPIKQSESDVDDDKTLTLFIMKWKNLGESHPCEECKFLKSVVDEIGNAVCSNQTYNFPDNYKNRLKDFKGINSDSCEICAIRNILAERCQSYV